MQNQILFYQQEGLNVIAKTEWNQASMIKLLWDLCNKGDSLWIKWIHTYYVDLDDIMNVPIKSTFSYILKNILKQITVIQNMQDWKAVIQDKRFNIKKFYYGILEQKQQVQERKLFYDNFARPRALFVMWLACQDRLETKARASKVWYAE